MIWMWAGFMLLVVGMLALDLGVFHRTNHAVGTKEALIWTGVWIALALLFSLFIYFSYEHHWAGLGLDFDEVAGGPTDGSEATINRYQSKPLYEAIVHKTRELGLAGATVLRGTDGFGARSVVHKAALLEMSSDLPMVIEIVDTEEKIKLLLPHLETMVAEGMITMEYVIILMYRHDRPSEPAPPA